LAEARGSKKKEMGLSAKSKSGGKKRFPNQEKGNESVRAREKAAEN